MSDFKGTVLVLGATGQTGVRVVKALRDKLIPVRAFVRDAVKAASLNAPGVEIMVGETDSETDLRHALMGIQAVISTIGAKTPNDLDEIERVEHLNVALLEKLSAELGIQQIVFCSSIGTETPDSLPFIANFLRAKRRGEQVLEQGSVPYTIVRPGGLTNDPGGQPIIMQRTLHPGGRISRDDVAEVLVQALLQPASQNQIVEIISQPEGVVSSQVTFAR